MEYNLGHMTIQTLMLDSENELRARIKEIGRGIILEDEQDIPTQAILVKARASGSTWQSYCGMLVAGHGISPQIAYHPLDFYCWIAFDQCLFLVSLLEPKCVASIRLPCLFWDLVLLGGGSVVAIHELGAVCFDEKAREVWQVRTPDKLVDYHLDANRILLESEDGKSVSHELKITRTN